MVIIIALILATTVALLLSGATNQRKKPSELDLRSVRDAMIEKHGWTEERVDAAQLEYVRFLTLLQTKPGFMLIPWLDASGRDDLDQFWHQHILDTEKYAADCNALFGRMIHHNPNVLRGSQEEKGAVKDATPLHSNLFIRDLWRERRSSGFQQLLNMRNCNCGLLLSSSLLRRGRWRSKWP